MRSLRPGQERALAYAVPRSRIFLAMEMRTGKSAVTIRWTKIRKLNRVLLIAPLTTIDPGWVEELHMEGLTGKIFDLTKVSKKKRLEVVQENGYGWFLINYEYVRSNPDLLLEFDRPCDGVVLDESTRIRSPRAQITKLLLRSTQTEYRALLSGMPNPESVTDWFTQMVWLNGSLLGMDNYWAFRGKYFYQPPWSSFNWKPKKGTVEKIKDEVHSSVFRLTSKQAGMGSNHVYEKRMVEMTPLQRKMQKTILKDFEYEGEETKWAPVQQTWLARLAGGFDPTGEDIVADKKLRELVSIIKEDLPKRSQVVIWARFRSEIRAIYDYLNKKGIRTARITGATDRGQRAIRIKNFRRGKYQAIVVQGRIGMYGLNLSTADTDIYYSNMWDNEVRSQCERRIEHMSKKVPLLHIDLITKDSVDEEVVPRLREKKMRAKQFNLMVNKVASRWRRVHPND